MNPMKKQPRKSPFPTYEKMMAYLVDSIKDQDKDQEMPLSEELQDQDET